MNTNANLLEKYKEEATKQGIDTAPILGFLDSLDKMKEEKKKESMQVTGFVQVKPFDDTVLGIVTEPTLFGLYVSGMRGFANPICRLMQADSRAPAWFKEAVKKEQAQPTGMQFRVRVCGLSARGRTAYVWPQARDLENAEREWKREQKSLSTRHQKLEDCKTIKEMSLFVYRKYGEIYNLMVVEYNPISMTAMMVENDDPTFLYSVTGASKIWNFTGGIAKGSTTLEKEMEMSINCRMLTRE